MLKLEFVADPHSLLANDPERVIKALYPVFSSSRGFNCTGNLIELVNCEKRGRGGK